jgi:hypothetical protein
MGREIIGGGILGITGEGEPILGQQPVINVKANDISLTSTSGEISIIPSFTFMYVLAKR